MDLCLVAACNLRCCSGPPGKIATPEASTLDGIEIVRFCVFAPPGSPLDRYAK